MGRGLRLLRKQGTFALYSVFKEEVAVDWTIISDDKELNVLGAHLGSVCWPDAARMDNSGKLPLDERGKRKEERGKSKIQIYMPSIRTTRRSKLAHLLGNC